MKTIAIYYRVSTERQDLKSQKDAISAWLEGLGDDKKPKKIMVFEDEGLSGKHTDRPAYQDMLKAAYAGKFDTIVVYRLDRFSRNASDAIKTLLSLDEIGVGFISVTQPVLNLGHENPFRRTMLAAFAEIAEIERQTIVTRVKAGLDAARQRGVKLGAPSKISADTKAKVDQMREEGLSLRAIAKSIGLSYGAVQKIVSQKEIPQAETSV